MKFMNYKMDIYENVNATLNKIIDLPPDAGVSFFVKHGFFNIAKSQGFDFDVVSNPTMTTNNSINR